MPLHCMEKINLRHLYIPTKNWYIYWDNARRSHCIAWRKIIWIILYTYQKLIIYWDENVSHFAPQGIPLCTGKFAHHYSGIFFQLLCTNQYFLIISLVFLTHTETHAYTQRHTHFTKGSIFISKFLSLKLGVWIHQ